MQKGEDVISGMDDVIRPLADARGYRVPEPNPRLHRELAWFATSDDRILGVLIEDQVDYDFSWVVLALDAPTGNYRAIDLAASCPTAAIATAQLQAAMRAWFEKPQHAVVEALR